MIWIKGNQSVQSNKGHNGGTECTSAFQRHALQGVVTWSWSTCLSTEAGNATAPGEKLLAEHRR